jgi:hypothetical protein
MPVFRQTKLCLACAKLVEIFGDLNFGIDRWFVRNPGYSAQSQPDEWDR